MGSSGLPSLRCFLFFPGSRPELFGKAAATGADGVCADLEDAVGPDGKDEARAAVVELLGREMSEEDTGRPVVIVRVNAPGTAAGTRDLDALLAGEALPDVLLIPKVVGPESVLRVEEALGGRGSALHLVPLIETARGLAAVEEVAACSDRNAALMIGGHDLALELGGRPEWEALLYARSRVVHAAALASLDALDMPLLVLSDPEALRREARAARALGFSGKSAIHPDQVAAIQEVFTPAPDEVAEARRIVEAYEDADGDAVLLDEKVVDQPVLEAARRTLARAEEIE